MAVMMPRQNWTDEKLDHFEKRVDERFDNFERSVDERFDRVDERLKQVDERLGRVEGSVQELSRAVTGMQRTIVQAAFAACAIMAGGFASTVAALIGVMAF